MSDLASAWLLNLGGDRCAAVGMSELQEVLAAPPLTDSPGAPVYCRYRIDWRGLDLPVMDLALVFGAALDPAPPRWLSIAAYRDPADQRPRFGALQLAAPPVAIQVSDDDACAIPETSLAEYFAWSYLSLCCFRHHDRIVPILDVPLLFSPQAHQRLQRYSMPSATLSAGQPPRRIERTT